jgi:hypothetical protein
VTILRLYIYPKEVKLETCMVCAPMFRVALFTVDKK